MSEAENALIVRQEHQLTEMSRIALQLGQAVARLEARLSALEAAGGRTTIAHRDALSLQRLIRARAGQIAEKYDLPETALPRIRAVIKKDVLRQYHIDDLHDLPENWLPACRALIDGWHSWIVIRGLI